MVTAAGCRMKRCARKKVCFLVQSEIIYTIVEVRPSQTLFASVTCCCSDCVCVSERTATSVANVDGTSRNFHESLRGTGLKSLSYLCIMSTFILMLVQTYLCGRSSCREEECRSTGAVVSEVTCLAILWAMAT